MRQNNGELQLLKIQLELRKIKIILLQLRILLGLKND